jgi:hypothetical protein
MSEMTRSRIYVVALVFLAACAAGCAQDGAHDPQNELPFGVVDVPKAGDVITPGRVLVGGWALDDSGIEEIRIYFDGRFTAATTVTVARPDVIKAYPKYVKGTDVHGWNVEIEVPNQPGPHTILAQAVDDRGATRDLGSFTVTIGR